jgi:uncharacterized protein
VIAPDATLVASRYNTFTVSAIPGTYLAFNVFTGALLELEAADYAAVEPLDGKPGSVAPDRIAPVLRERLLAAGVLVPQGFDERAALFDLRRKYIDASDTLLLTLAPTIQCNFRCTYCFETHRQEVMTPKIEMDLMRFIAHNAHGTRAITTTWFGGEPLLEPDTIERIQRFTNELGNARGLKVSRGIVTNGYFLTPDVIGRLQALGEWEMVQVTLDGPPPVHNSRRVLLGGQGTWDRIIANCRTAIGMGLRINLRVNVDRRNVSLLGTLLDRLIAEGILPGASIGLGFVTDSTTACSHVKDDVLTDEDRARISIWFEGELLRRNLLPSGGLPSPLCGPMCSVESKRGYVIAPSGLIFKCWHQIDGSAEQAIGHVSGTPVPNAEAELERWTRYDPAQRKGCSNCKALPTCQGGCPWEYERLARVHNGECDTFRFFPKELVKIGHLRSRVGQGQPAVRLAV